MQVTLVVLACSCVVHVGVDVCACVVHCFKSVLALLVFSAA